MFYFRWIKGKLCNIRSLLYAASMMSLCTQLNFGIFQVLSSHEKINVQQYKLQWLWKYAKFWKYLKSQHRFMSLTIEMFSKLNQKLENYVKIHISHMSSSIYLYIKLVRWMFFVIVGQDIFFVINCNFVIPGNNQLIIVMDKLYDTI